jgi:ABC-type lipoprotein release transport system permease subunit
LGERFYLQIKCLIVILLMSVLCNFFNVLKSFKTKEKEKEKEASVLSKGGSRKQLLKHFFFFPFPT